MASRTGSVLSDTMQRLSASDLMASRASLTPLSSSKKPTASSGDGRAQNAQRDLPFLGTYKVPSASRNMCLNLRFLSPSFFSMAATSHAFEVKRIHRRYHTSCDG